MKFTVRELTEKIFITKKTSSTTRLVKFIPKNKFAKTILDENAEVFLTNINSLTVKMTIYLAK